MAPYADERGGTGHELPVAASHMESGHSSVPLQIRLKQLVGLRHIKKAELFSPNLFPIMIYFRPAERTRAIKIHGQARSFRRQDRPPVSAGWFRLALLRCRTLPLVVVPSANLRSSQAQQQRPKGKRRPASLLRGHNATGELRRRMAVRKLR